VATNKFSLNVLRGLNSAALTQLINATVPPGEKGDKGDKGDTGAKGDPGASIVWRGAWSESTTYAALDGVTYGGSSWRAVAASTGQAPSEGAYWTILAEKGDKGDTGAAGQDGADGVGIPALGTTGQLLAKKTDTNFDTEWVDAPSGGGGVNLALLAHSNQVSSNTDTDYSTVATASVFASALRFKREAMKFFFVEKGNGNCQFVITDGTTTVTANGTNANSSVDALGKIEADCSTLAYGVWWTVTVNSKAVSGAYEMRRINIMADPASPMTGNTIMLSTPGYPVNSATPVLVERKYYPTHYLIDADANISLDALITVTSGTVTLRAVVTPVMDMTGTLTTPPTSEESSASTTTTGNVNLLIPVPTILAPMIRVDLYMTGVGSCDKLCAWAEV